MATGSSSSLPTISISSILNLVSIKLNPTNYLLWKSQFVPLLGSQNLLGYVDGTILPPSKLLPASNNETPQPNPLFEKWNQTDQLLLSWINATLSEEVLCEVVGLNTAQEVWSTLANTYAQRSKAREYQLRHQLQICKKDSSSMSDYLRKFKSLCDSLAAIGHPVSDEDRVFWVLNGLGPSYESFVTSVLAKPPFPSYDQLIPNLISQDIHVGEHGSIHDTAFFSQSTNRTFRIGQRSTRFNSSHQTRGNPNKASILGAPPLICQVCRKQGHSAIDCWHRFNNTYTSKHNQQPPSPPSHALTALTISDPSDPQWYPDTGASSHMTSNQGEKIREVQYCKHIFHKDCLDKWLQHDSATCPLCRSTMLPEKIGVELRQLDDEGEYDGRDEELIFFLPALHAVSCFELMGGEVGVIYRVRFGCKLANEQPRALKHGMLSLSWTTNLLLDRAVLFFRKQVDEVKGEDVVCVIKNSATLVGSLFTLHISQIRIDLPTLIDNDKEVIIGMGISTSSSSSESQEIKNSNENVIFVEGTIGSNEVPKLASLHSQQGRKGSNQDVAILHQATNGSNEGEAAPSSENTPSETILEPETEEEPTTVARKLQKPSLKQMKTKPLPLSLRNQGRRRMQPWIWVLMALLVLALFLVGIAASLLVLACQALASE
ncbi:hypothetical protein HHK36_030631 [Tetracentron sinense]|uniref:RING-type domain-containing protein n=1 Tax=Tetracentron sinense TaxID=13715 RepID=A0A834Y833_TETSI|nr:hypothetical protein HHK36_030631 [Tetracentron sinense]